MRKAFIAELCRLAALDERIWLLTADLGYGVIEPFAEQFPDRFVNVGVAEQNMIGVATGLAKTGLIPFCWSITPFALLRPLEFIKNGPLLHDLPVHIVGTGIGEEYKTAGPTHWCEDAEGICNAINLDYYRLDCMEAFLDWRNETTKSRHPSFLHLPREVAA